MASKLLVADEFEGESGALFSMAGKFRRVPLAPGLQDLKEGERFWTFSETLVRSALGQTAPAF
jgi:hypothetical protein